MLSVTARREESYGEEERLFVRERPMRGFIRRVYLSEHLDAEHIEAANDNGVLLLVAVLFSLAVALSAALLKIKEGARTTAVISSAGIAFAGSMALCVPTLTTVDLL